MQREGVHEQLRLRVGDLTFLHVLLGTSNARIFLRRPIPTLGQTGGQNHALLSVRSDATKCGRTSTVQTRSRFGTLSHGSCQHASNTPVETQLLNSPYSFCIGGEESAEISTSQSPFSASVAHWLGKSLPCLVRGRSNFAGACVTNQCARRAAALPRANY
jgi:hypothetical protein